jgi:hypothetical protein
MSSPMAKMPQPLESEDPERVGKIAEKLAMILSWQGGSFIETQRDAKSHLRAFPK